MKPPVNRCTWVLEQQNNNEEPLQYSGRERWNSMGIIKAAISSIGSGFADQWLEYIRAGKMDDRTVMSAGVAVRGRDRRNANTKGSADYISDGSLIEVGVNQCMLLVDGGRIVDFTTEPGYYKVDNQATPSAFSGSFSQALEESFDRLRFGGVPSRSQKAYFINLQEIKGIAFGTPTPINYFDSFYNAELYLRTNGYFSIRITDPIRFYAEAIPHDRDMVTIEDILEEIFGEIEDEHDSQDLVEKKMSDNEYLFSGRLEIEYVNEKYRLDFPESENYDTLAGYVIDKYQGIPSAGETILSDNKRIKILRTNASRIELMRVTIV